MEFDNVETVKKHWRLMQVWPFYLLVQLEMKSKEISLSPLSFKAEFTIVPCGNL